MVNEETRPSTAVPVNGAALRELRIRSGISMADFAEEVGIDRSYLNKIEVEERQVSPQVYQALLRALRIRDYRALLRTADQDGAAA